MIAPESTGQMHAHAAERVLAERWADFTKALAIYPATNVRVQQNLEAMLTALEHARSAQEGPPAPGETPDVAILFRDGTLVYGDVEEPIGAGTNLAWLQARLAGAALAGVAFGPDIGADALIEFTKELLAVFLHKLPDPTFETLWPHSYGGLTLIDRRFEGGFGGTGQSLPYRGGHAEQRTSAAGEKKLVAVLLADESVSEQLRRLDQLATEPATKPDDRVSATDLLERILENLPAETMRNRRTLMKAVSEILSSMESRREAHGWNGPVSDEMTLRALVHSVSRTYFARQGPEAMHWALEEALPESTVAPAKRGHAGDDLIHEDVDALIEEVAGLPGELAVDLSEQQAELPAEHVAVFLHYLVNIPDPTRLEGLYAALGKLVKDPDPQVLAVLREYLKAEGHHKDGEDSASPILSFLRATRRTELLRECGVLRAEWVAQVFPQFFMLFLESVDPGTHSGLDEIDAICRQVGTQRFLDALPALESEGLPLPAAAAAELLTKPQIARLPLARLLLQLYGRSILGEITQFLRKLDLEAPEAFVLYQLGDVSYMTVEYVKGLMDLSLDRIPANRLHLPIADVLCRHIRGTQESAPRSAARMESIRNLARFPSANSWFMLNELARMAWNPFARREPALVRRLARSIQRNYKAA